MDNTNILATRYRAVRVGIPFLTRRTVLVLEVKRHLPEGPPDSSGMPSYLSCEFWEEAQAFDLVDIIERRLDSARSVCLGASQLDLERLYPAYGPTVGPADE